MIKYEINIYIMPGTVLSILYPLAHLIFIMVSYRVIIRHHILEVRRLRHRKVRTTGS